MAATPRRPHFHVRNIHSTRREPAWSHRTHRAGAEPATVRPLDQARLVECPGNSLAFGFNSTAMLLTAVAASPNPVAMSLTFPG